jgi:hypothetical protein
MRRTCNRDCTLKSQFYVPFSALRTFANFNIRLTHVELTAAFAPKQATITHYVAADSVGYLDCNQRREGRTSRQYNGKIAAIHRKSHALSLIF